MMAGGAAFGIGTALEAGAQNIGMLVIGRIVLGVGVGFATMATPLYLSEMAPHSIRGTLNIKFQLAVTIRIFAAQLINYGTFNIPDYLSMAGASPLLSAASLLCSCSSAHDCTPKSEYMILNDPA